MEGGGDCLNHGLRRLHGFRGLGGRVVGDVCRTRKPCAYGEVLSGRTVDGRDSEIARKDAAGSRDREKISIARDILFGFLSRPLFVQLILFSRLIPSYGCKKSS